MKVLLIEDQQSWQIKIAMMLEELGWELVHTLSSIEGLQESINNFFPDLIISDIVLGDSLAFDFFTKNLELRTPIVFMTNYATDENYQSVKTLHRAVLLIKPFHAITLKSTVDLLLKNYTKTINKTTSGIAVRGKQNQKILLEEVQIRWIHSNGNYCFFHTETNKYALKISMIKLIKDSLGSNFLQIHRAYLVNSQHIQRMDLAHFAIWVNGQSLPIGRKFKDKLVKYFFKE